MATLTTPRGTKFRYEGKRRFVLVREGTGYTGRAEKMNRPIVMQRSDSLDTLRTVVRRQEIRDVARFGSMVDYSFIIDSRTGEAVPLRRPVPESVRDLRAGDTIRLFGEGQRWQEVHVIEQDTVSWRVSLDEGWFYLSPNTTVRRLVRDEEIAKG